ncbi:hypothetical protein CEN44_01925 [Fischerella muscicola CCMEE 5323]|uniref:Uncharacterized protein n=1 Tax=Fischerella muscicola CCMEE 5323 TaxID=2019572 RepID=A0A2N6K8H5_FISMU|nr:hypothetical protein CEN44_01925 [Fischerella muscicola CCMEE 5323]
MTMAFSLKNKNRRVCSAVHRAVSIRKLNSLPVNHPKPVIIVGIAAKHVRGALFEKFNLDLYPRTITDGLSIVNTFSGNSKKDKK